jgi:hypothetical protein
MKIRMALPQDVEQIKNLCKKHSLDVPTLQHCFVAEADGEIIGYINAMVIPIIDMVCDNPLTSKSLHETFNGFLLGHGFGSVIMFTKKEDVENVAVKFGYKQVKESMNIYSKEL